MPERLGVGDAGEYLTLQRAAYVVEAQAHAAPSLPPLTETLDTMRAVLADPATRAWGVRDAGRLIAAVRVVIDDDVARLGRLAVAPDRQREGWATALMETVERELAGEVRAVELFTGERSAGPLRLYRRRGYRETARTPEASYDLIHFRRDLGAGAGAGAGTGDRAGAGAGVSGWTVRRAGPGDDGDAHAVRALLDERVRWLHAHGITDQWDGPFDPRWLRGDLDAGCTWLVDDDHDGGAPAATFVLALGPGDADPWWTGAETDGDPGAVVATLRRLAVRPDRAGLGRALLGWIADYARTHGATRLRLACVAGNPALCAYYAGAGFTDRGTVEVAGQRGEGRTFVMRRFERVPRAGGERIDVRVAHHDMG